jgi:hypothetical protein
LAFKDDFGVTNQKESTKLQISNGLSKDLMSKIPIACMPKIIHKNRLDCKKECNIQAAKSECQVK